MNQQKQYYGDDVGTFVQLIVGHLVVHSKIKTKNFGLFKILKFSSSFYIILSWNCLFCWNETRLLSH